MKMTECEILKGMIKVLGRGGRRWIKGGLKYVMSDGEYGYCLVGAYREVAEPYPYSYMLGTYASAELDLPTLVNIIRQETNHTSIDGFNDATETDWKKLRKVLGKAVKAACAREER